MARTRIQASQSAEKPPHLEFISVSKLHLDPENPRLPPKYTGASQQAILEYLFETGALEELAQSFIDNGYFAAEPLIVIPSKKDFIVVEGNRRLAALKILQGEPIADDLEFVSVQAQKSDLARLDQVPCHVVPDREDVVPFIGFRHIGGLKMWGPEAKARYLVAQVKDAHRRGSEDPFRDIGRKVGSNALGVRSSFFAWEILRYGNEQLGVKNVSRLLSERRFGVWLRALNSPQLRDYIGVGDPTSYEEVNASLPRIKRDRLREVVADLVGEKDEQPLVSDSRLVTDYAKVLAEPEARKVLRQTRDLELARQVVDKADLPSRIRQLTDRAEILARELEHLDEVPEELQLAIKPLYNVARRMRLLAFGTGEEG